MVRFQGAQTADDPDRSSDGRKVPPERDPQPKVQLFHLPAAGAVRAVSVLSESVLPDHGRQPVHPGHPDRLPVHVLGSAGLRAGRDDLSRGGGRSAAAQARSRGQLAKV
uniref:(northern house mosquito) hypothetical protein n=1 Tax=Culex pipiens TaxID=7175 RepID=A0A8D8JD61_CULPI